jgi:predicted exporter
LSESRVSLSWRTAPARAGRGWAAAALAWLAVVLAVAVHQWSFWHHARVDTDVLALLPEDEQAPEVAQATRQLVDQASRQVIVMIGAPVEADARRAAAAWRSTLPATLGWRAIPAADPDALAGAIHFYQPWRDRLLTAAQRQHLERTPPQALLAEALAALHQPGGAARLTDWSADPLSLWPQWWAQRGGETLARPRDGEFALTADRMEWLLLPYDTGRSAFTLDGQALYGDAIAAARLAATAAAPGVRVLAAGVPLHAEAAAVQASREISTIGWGSLAAVVLLVWLAFRRLLPIVLIALSLVIGLAVALSVTWWIFGQVHLITLVFGATLVGVAEDYGIHYFSSRRGAPGVAPRSAMQHLLPGLALALATSVLAYAALGIAPFPGLRQMGVFSVVGLTAAFLTAVCWFPWLDRGAVPASRFAAALAGSLTRWPVLANSRGTWVLATATALFASGGLAQLRASDDLRQLQSSPAALMQDQRDLARLVGAPSPGQFFLVSGATAEQVLQREEALTARLDLLVANGALAGYRALSDWLPSQARQRADAALTGRVEPALLAGINAALGESLARPAFAAAALTLEHWLAQPVSAPARGLWLGDIGGGTQASVVMLRGLDGAAQLPRLQAAGAGLDGVHWVDRTADISSLLGRYRLTMSWLLVLGHAAVLLALAARYGTAAWRAWLPTAAASLLCIAALGWLGQPLQLFNVLALALLLGVGVDYGVFLLEHRGDGSAWLAVVLGAASTWLAFGLLALSGTPALRAFGLTLLIGLPLVALLAPALRAHGTAPSPALSSNHQERLP